MLLGTTSNKDCLYSGPPASLCHPRRTLFLSHLENQQPCNNFSAVPKKKKKMSQTVRSTLYREWWRSLNLSFWNISAQKGIKECCSLMVRFKREDNIFTVWLHKTLKIQVTKLMFIQYVVYFLGQTNCHVYAELTISLPYFSNHLPTALSAPYYRWSMIMKL